jgi:tryptophanyl-tRNA synthetase
MVTPVPWLERVPTYKEMKEQLADKDLSSLGFLGYPVLQTADILAYRATLVPVGEDQVAHLELGREVVRRFNHLYGETFPEPKPLLTGTPRLPGPDRRKMSKSYGNAVELGDDPKTVAKQVQQMYTDPEKIHLGDRGHPEGCVVYAWHRTFNAAAAPEIERTCRDGSRGCGACKKDLLGTLEERLAPVREARARHLKDPGALQEILAAGARKARAIAAETLADVRKAMRLR